MSARHVTDDEVGRLYDLLATRDVTKREMAAHLGVGARRCDDVVRSLRLLLGDDDTINVVAIPQRGPWLYRLVGTYGDAKPWTKNRTLDVRSRLETVNQVLSSLARGADGRTVDGKMVHLLQRTITRALEDLEEML